MRLPEVGRIADANDMREKQCSPWLAPCGSGHAVSSPFHIVEKAACLADACALQVSADFGRDVAVVAQRSIHDAPKEVDTPRAIRALANTLSADDLCRRR